MSKEKGFHDKLKNFFKGLNKGSHVPRPRSEEYITLSEELENDLKRESPIGVRLKAVKEINEVAKVRRLESFAVEKLWMLLEDLLKPDVARETRHSVFILFITLCQFQLDKNGYLRAKFFNFIKAHNVEEDAGPKFEFLKALTDNGRDVSYFDDRIAPLILSWMGGPHSFKKTGDFMIFLNNFLKFNQSFVDQNVLASIIQNVCYIACTSASRQDTLECIKVLETVICYGSLPSNSLSTFLATLCRTVNVEFLCQASWKTVRNLLLTHHGHAGLLTMCEFMKIADRTEDYTVIRGAVFFVGVSLWGTNMVRTLKYSPSMVLSSFSEALDRKQIYISYEVMLRIQDYVRFSGDTMQSITWESVLDIIEPVVDDIQGGEWKDDTVNHAKIVKVVGDTLDVIENLIESGGFSGALHRFYAIIESARTFRPESSIEKLMNYKHRHLLQCTVPNWLNHLIFFCERNFREELRPNLKVKAIKIIHEVAITQLETHEDELIEKVILQYFKALEQEPDIQVRQAGVQFIIQFLMESTSKKCHDVLSILEKIVHRPYEHHTSNTALLRPNEAIDISTAINGLIDLYQKKIYQLPSTVAIYCYRILVRHLTHHYKRINVLDHCSTIRYNIFNCFFKIRANSLYHLGFATSDDPESPCTRFSPYLAVDHREGENREEWKSDQGEMLLGSHATSSSSSLSSLTGSFANSHSNQAASPPILHPANGQTAVLALLYANTGSKDLPTPIVTSISLTLACKLVVTSLKKEKDWKILELVLSKLPRVLENKALVLSKHGNDIDYLALALCDLMTDKSGPATDTLRNAPQSNFRTEFQNYIFPILTSLISYHTHLEPAVQLKIVKCLELGLTSRSSRMCILALSISTLEMKDTMHKLLPEVLHALSKISPKKNIAIPVLEFLSTLIHLPRVFASFVQEQYMSIFAIALPYTNPFKFNQYTVSLAHHVIAMWFLKCRLSFRKGFVSFIIKGLESNVWTPFEEETRKNDRELQNEDSSNRKRSSSLTDQTFKRRERPISGHHPPQHPTGLHSSARYHPVLDWKPPMDKSLMTFHQELTETCVDLMARYAFADCAALPTPFQSSSLLLTGGLSQTWLADNRIITITTSGCTQKELRDGLCDKCWLLCRKIVDPGSSAGGGVDEKGGSCEQQQDQQRIMTLGSAEIQGQRRRHRSAFAGSSSQGRLSRPDSLEEQGVLPTMIMMMNGKVKDDLHLDNKLGDLMEGYSISSTEMSLKPKLIDHTYCTCWCQGWAEVHIRRPTGNTSWMMRVQNQMGNQASLEFPIKELSAMYLNTLFTVKASNSASDPTTAQSSPTTQTAQQPMIGPSSKRMQDKQQPPLVLNKTKSPPSPRSPASPVEEYSGEGGLKNPVRRSNSSPEMCSSWKAPFLNQQRDIREQDEDEPAAQIENVGKPGTTVGTVNGQQSSTELSVEGGEGSKKGSVSPFQCYDTIPEENPQIVVDKTEDLTPRRRDRMSTISVMSPARGNPRLRRMTSTDISTLARSSTGNPSGGESGIRSGISPGFIFLQLCAQGLLDHGNSKPILVPNTEASKKSLKVLDYIPPYETHKIGVVYVGPGQVANETQILQNQYGSSRYREFLSGLGKLIKLSQVDPQKVFLGGLSRDGVDGEYAPIWQDDVMQVIFHAATLMPNKPTDPMGNAKKCHIGNDYVAIVYNNSEEDYDIGTIKGQFLYAGVVIQPLDHRTNRVIVKAKPGLADLIGHTEPKIVSDQNLPIMARQWALHSNLASHIFQNMQRPGADLYASNWLERLRHIKRLRTRLTQEGGGGHHHSTDEGSHQQEGLTSRRSFNVDDFTEFV